MACKKETVIAIILAILLTNIRVTVAPSGGAMGGSVGSSSSSSSSSSSTSSSGSPGRIYPVYGGYTYYDYHGSESGSGRFDWKNFFIILGASIGCFLIFALLIKLSLRLKKNSSVLMLQIGLSKRETISSVQRDLRRITHTTNTNNLAGLDRIIRETTNALLKHQDCWMYGYESVDSYHNDEKTQQRFRQLENQERAKVDFESLVNVNNVKHQLPAFIPKDEVHLQESFIVVTMLLKVRGWHERPAIKDSKSMNKALQHLGSLKIREDDTVLVLWSPQDERETLSEKQLKENYVLLKPIGNLSRVPPIPSHIINIG